MNEIQRLGSCVFSPPPTNTTTPTLWYATKSVRSNYHRNASTLVGQPCVLETSASRERCAPVRVRVELLTLVFIYSCVHCCATRCPGEECTSDGFASAQVRVILITWQWLIFRLIRFIETALLFFKKIWGFTLWLSQQQHVLQASDKDLKSGEGSIYKTAGLSTVYH